MELDLYVDGSFYKDNPTVTQGGIVILKDLGRGKEVITVRHVNTRNPNFVSAHNAGGEVIASLVGILDAATESRGEKCVVNVFYDYRGVKDFIDGTYTAKKEGMIQYKAGVEEVLRANPNIELKFHKVKAHSGNKYNDLADLIAKGSIPVQYKEVNKTIITI